MWAFAFEKGARRLRSGWHNLNIRYDEWGLEAKHVFKTRPLMQNQMDGLPQVCPVRTVIPGTPCRPLRYPCFAALSCAPAPRPAASPPAPGSPSPSTPPRNSSAGSAPRNLPRESRNPRRRRLLFVHLSPWISAVAASSPNRRDLKTVLCSVVIPNIFPSSPLPSDDC